MKKFDPVASLFLARVLTDVPVGCDGAMVYVMGQTQDNMLDCLVQADVLRRRYEFSSIGITALGKKNGFVGYRYCAYMLRGLGNVKPANVVRIKAAENPNTFTEAVNLVEYATLNKLRTVVVVAPLFHLPRAFLSVVSAAFHAGAEKQLRIIASGVGINWGRKIVHSQGITTGTCEDIFQGELQRIVRYQEKGDLVSLEKALEYMRLRGSIPLR